MLHCIVFPTFTDSLVAGVMPLLVFVSCMSAVLTIVASMTLQWDRYMHREGEQRYNGALKYNAMHKAVGVTKVMSLMPQVCHT